ncbi:hypothetical protein I7I51_00206 [Histoplasma capsulatum]|uniref:Uncharacterized protein n=1 Tax=Ajellomyces capsulatus TaxID=5037 RepID=A0A8A1MB32_AJECA|nr:hypothetical protein I7I51_00206 [Histoplasma capsulatum]
MTASSIKGWRWKKGQARCESDEVEEGDEAEEEGKGETRHGGRWAERSHGVAACGMRIVYGSKGSTQLGSGRDVKQSKYSDNQVVESRGWNGHSAATYPVGSRKGGI